MKKYVSLLALLLLAVGSYCQKHVDNQLIIQSLEPLEKVLLTQNITLDNYAIETIYAPENVYRISYEQKADLDTEILKWQRLKGIKHVMKNYIAESRNRPNDLLFSDQLGMELINMEDAWDLTTGGMTREGKEIVVAVIDDGFDLTHDDLSDNIWNNPHEIANDGIDNDNNGYIDDMQGIRAGTASDAHPVSTHGNSVVGTIGAKGDNDIGVTGVNWNIKVMTITSNGSVDQILESYYYVLEQRRRYNDSDGSEGSFIVATNASFGIDYAFASDYPIWCETYDLLGSEGILSIGATTNETANVDIEGDMPTTCPSQFLIGVTTTDEESIVDAGYGSNSIDIVAPGDEGYTTSINNNYRAFTGTSSAAPMVAGAIGLFYSLDSDLINSSCSPSILAMTLKEILLSNVSLSETFRLNTVSGGILDVDQTCRAILALNASTNDQESLLSICSFTTGPVTDIVMATLSNPENESYEVVIYNDQGQVMIHQNSNETDCYKIDVASYSSGIYFLSVISDQYKETRKFMKL